MYEQNDVVVGCVTNYEFDAIRPWVNSLDRCGFSGAKVMIVYNVSKGLVEELKKRNYSVFAFQEQGDRYVYRENFSIVVERFFHLWSMLSPLKNQLRYLISTDVKDVIFQRNPSEYMEKRGWFEPQNAARIHAASESIRYQDEAWGKENLRASYGNFIYETHKENRILNAGTLSGNAETMLDFFLNVYMVSAAGKTHNPDQAAVNILLAQKTYRDQLFVSEPIDAWACQAGTTDDPRKIEQYRQFLTDKYANKNYMEGDTIYNGLGEPYCIVHQWDRVPEWSEMVRRVYG